MVNGEEGWRAEAQDETTRHNAEGALRGESHAKCRHRGMLPKT